MNSEIESNNVMFNTKMMDEGNSDTFYFLNNYDDDESTNNSKSINESFLELMENDYENEFFSENIYSEIDNIFNFNNLCQGLSNLSNFKAQPLEVKKKIMSIMSRKRKRTNN